MANTQEIAAALNLPFPYHDENFVYAMRLALNESVGKPSRFLNRLWARDYLPLAGGWVSQHGAQLDEVVKGFGEASSYRDGLYLVDDIPELAHGKVVTSQFLPHPYRLNQSVITPNIVRTLEVLLHKLKEYGVNSSQKVQELRESLSWVRSMFDMSETDGLRYVDITEHLQLAVANSRPAKDYVSELIFYLRPLPTEDIRLKLADRERDQFVQTVLQRADPRAIDDTFTQERLRNYQIRSIEVGSIRKKVIQNHELLYQALLGTGNWKRVKDREGLVYIGNTYSMDPFGSDISILERISGTHTPILVIKDVKNWTGVEIRCTDAAVLTCRDDFIRRVQPVLATEIEKQFTMGTGKKEGIIIPENLLRNILTQYDRHLFQNLDQAVADCLPTVYRILGIYIKGKIGDYLIDQASQLNNGLSGQRYLGSIEPDVNRHWLLTQKPGKPLELTIFPSK